MDQGWRTRVQGTLTCQGPAFPTAGRSQEAFLWVEVRRANLPWWGWAVTGRPCPAGPAWHWRGFSREQQWACLGVTWGLEVGGIGGNTFLSVKSPGAGALSALSQERAVSGRNRAQGSSAVLGDAKPALVHLPGVGGQRGLQALSTHCARHWVLGALRDLILLSSHRVR